MDLTALEHRAALARNALACAFASSDEFEQALISERRAEGRYGSWQGGWRGTWLGTWRDWPMVAVIALSLGAICAVLLMV